MRFNRKKLLPVLLTAAIVLTLLSSAAMAAGEAVGGDVLVDNFVRVTTSDAFSQGTLQDLEVSGRYGNGALTLTGGAADGVYESPELTVPAFEYLVASWSADTPEGTWVEVSARAFVDRKNAWSSWLSWGRWSPYIQRACTDDRDDLACVDTDTLTILGDEGETASRVRFRVALHTDDPAVTPVFRELCGTLRNTLAGQEIPVFREDPDTALPDSVLIDDAPAISQMVRDVRIADSICSPTTVTMMLNARGEDLLPEEVALREYDYRYSGFGNWSFSVAMAGVYGYTGYCHYGDLDFVRRELAAGRTVGLSVSYSNKKGNAYPYLENAPIAGTGGHLVSIVGYGREDGVDYFYSNDSAAVSDGESALRKYRADQLDQAWSGRICYVISKEKEKNAGFAAPGRVKVELAYAKKTMYDILTDGQPVAGLSRDFGARTGQPGAGSVLLIPYGAGDTAARGTASCLATHDLKYLSVNSHGQLDVGTSPHGRVYIILNNGPTYVAEYGTPPVAPWIFWTAGIGAGALAALVFFLLRRRRKRRAGAGNADHPEQSGLLR